MLHNDGQRLSLEFELEYTGAYSYTRTRHAVFALGTGQRLRLADVLTSPPDQLR